MHIGDDGTRWGFKEKLALLEAILEVEANNTKTMHWNHIGPKYRAYANTIRSDDACRNYWQKNWIEKKPRMLKWLGNK